MTEKQLTSSSTPPRILGLTGGIGAGKSFVGQMLVEAGLPLMDSDAVARGAYTESEQVRQQVVALLGAEVYSPDGKPRYDEIASKVFAPSDAGKSLLHQLEQIIHPYVSERLTAWAMEQDSPEGWVVLESAILWQSGFYRLCDAVVVVTAPEAVRVARVQERDGASREQVQARIDRQASYTFTALQQRYPELPLYQINNDGVQDLEEQVAQLRSHLASL
ncbi:dephospho-CoA kinase [Porphyromonas vaginalis]|uniref:dephospho-CoA kinase n=1 Tax=Porphyromonas vaginalis TaxID=3044325 RepID=UPI00261A6DC7|nr:dephospho-CoA kinase [Porphyromonas vaginalis]